MRRCKKGFTLIELIVSFTILMLLATMAVPLARFKVRVEKRRELRNALETMRTAIDKYKDACDYGAFGPPKLETECYPESLDALVDGVPLASSTDGKKVKFLRRIPKDPFTGQREWGMRNTKDDPHSTSWGGSHVFDVYSKTFERAPDGTPYSEW